MYDDSESIGFTMKQLMVMSYGADANLKQKITEVIKSISDQDNDGYKFVGDLRHIEFYKFSLIVLDMGYEDKLKYAGNGRWSVVGKFWYFPKSSKWSVIGKNKIYKSKSFKDFIARFVEAN